MGRMDLGRL